MNKYKSAFNELVSNPSLDSSFGEAILWVPIDTSVESRAEEAARLIRQMLKNLRISPPMLIGHCFLYTRNASMMLCDEGIVHTVTVGNVNVDGRPYFLTTHQSLKQEFELGYVAGEPAHAHTWLTLHCGSIIDLTILSSLAHREKRSPLKMIQAIYCDDVSTNNRIQHVPMLLGPMYQCKVVTEPNESQFHMQYQWIMKIDTLLESVQPSLPPGGPAAASRQQGRG
jgi:hypothetical protein